MDSNFLGQSLLEAKNGAFETFTYSHEFLDALSDLWLAAPSAAAQKTPEQGASLISAFSGVDPHLIPAFLRPPPPLPTAWTIAFTPSFRKSVSSVDKKMQGRVLEALSELSEAPATIQGDTKKPLVGGMKGLWRYRVGNYRLVYEPRIENHLVILLEFAARGSVYAT